MYFQSTDWRNHILQELTAVLSSSIMISLWNILPSWEVIWLSGESMSSGVRAKFELWHAPCLNFLRFTFFICKVELVGLLGGMTSCWDTGKMFCRPPFKYVNYGLHYYIPVHYVLYNCIDLYIFVHIYAYFGMHICI